MRKSKYTDEQIIAILNEADAGVGTKETARKYGVTEQTIYRWNPAEIASMRSPRGPSTKDRRLVVGGARAHENAQGRVERSERGGGSPPPDSPVHRRPATQRDSKKNLGGLTITVSLPADGTSP